MVFKISISEQLHFAQRDMERRRELSKKNHAAAELTAMRNALGEKVMLDEPRILDDLIALGFDADNIGVLPLVPLIAVAWADGEVQKGEAKSILSLAEKRGVASGTAAHNKLSELLGQEPPEGYLNSCLYVLREFYDTLDPAETERAKRNLLGFTYVVAKAAGGVMGLFGNRVSDDEQSAISEIAELLGVGKSRNMESIHELVAVGASETSD